jgi:ubiquinone biosynthesis protein
LHAKILSRLVITEIRSVVGFAAQLPRYNEIVTILFKYGFADVLKLVAWQQLMGAGKGGLETHATGLLSKPPEERLRLALEELGPTFIKFGQILSSRRDLVDDSYYAELCKLQDNVPTFPGSLAKEIFAREIGMTVGEAFLEFEEKPLAGASIAQVHRAVTREGAAVAVKVQRPDIRPMIEQDLSILLDLAKFLELHVPDFASLNPVAVVQEFAETLLMELDFTHEAGNSERFAEQFKESPAIRVPKLFRELSGEKILTMEFISGESVTKVEELRSHGIDPVILSESISGLIYEQVFTHGFFHGDPHPGNMTIIPSKDVPCGGVLGLYDYGMMGAFSPSFRSNLAHLIAGLGEKDNRQVMLALIDLSEDGEVEDFDRMLRDVEEFSDKYLNKPLSEINLSMVLNNLLELLRRHRLRMKGGFYLGVKALTQVEAVGRALNPGLNFVELGRPYAEKLISGKYMPSHLLELLKKLGTASIDFLEVFPSDFRVLWNRMKRGEITIPVQHRIDAKGIEPIRQTLDSIANRLANAIVAASVLIGSAILIHSGIPPKIWHIPLIGLAGLCWGGFMCLRIALSTWKHGGL